MFNNEQKEEYLKQFSDKSREAIDICLSSFKPIEQEIGEDVAYWSMEKVIEEAIKTNGSNRMRFSYVYMKYVKVLQYKKYVASHSDGTKIVPLHLSNLQDPVKLLIDKYLETMKDVKIFTTTDEICRYFKVHVYPELNYETNMITSDDIVIILVGLIFRDVDVVNLRLEDIVLHDNTIIIGDTIISGELAMYLKKLVRVRAITNDTVFTRHQGWYIKSFSEEYVFAYQDKDDLKGRKTFKRAFSQKFSRDVNKANESWIQLSDIETDGRVIKALTKCQQLLNTTDIYSSDIINAMNIVDHMLVNSYGKKIDTIATLKALEEKKNDIV